MVVVDLFSKKRMPQEKAPREVFFFAGEYGKQQWLVNFASMIPVANNIWRPDTIG